MALREAFKLALQSLWANKLRTVLTLISVIVGIATVIMVVMLTEGAKQFVTAKIDTYGASVITIRKMPQVFNTIDEFIEFQKRRDVTYDDFRAVLSDCKSCVSVRAQRTTARGKVLRGTRSTTDTEVRG
jgi:putative ABC transport system permease protein